MRERHDMDVEEAQHAFMMYVEPGGSGPRPTYYLLDDGLRVGRRAGHGLLHQHVLPVLQRQQRVLPGESNWMVEVNRRINWEQSPSLYVYHHHQVESVGAATTRPSITKKNQPP